MSLVLDVGETSYCLDAVGHEVVVDEALQFEGVVPGYAGLVLEHGYGIRVSVVEAVVVSVVYGDFVNYSDVFDFLLKLVRNDHAVLECL